MEEKINYAPHSGEVLPNRNLSIPTFGRAANGEIWDGRVEIMPGHPNYAVWLSQINNKAAYHVALDEERKQAREQRRQRHSP